ncbi:MAG: hypothetical protein ABH857_01085 [Elusimicrobiota bacterium]
MFVTKNCIIKRILRWGISAIAVFAVSAFLIPAVYAYDIRIEENYAPQQGEKDIEFTITTSVDMQDATTAPYTYKPVFWIEGVTVTDVAWYNSKTLKATVDLTNSAPGPHAAYVLADITPSSPPWGGTIALVQSASATFTVKSKPEIYDCSPKAAYQGKGNTDITLIGKNFYSLNTSNGFLSISGSGITKTGINWSSGVSNYLTVSAVNISSSALPGTAPYPIYFENQDGGGNTSKDTQGEDKGIFTIYPHPAILLINKTNVYQGQEDVQVSIYGSGFHSSSIVVISTASADYAAGAGGVNIISSKVEGDTLITLTLSVEEDADITSTKNRTFFVINADGSGTNTNISAQFTKSNFVTARKTFHITSIEGSLYQGETSTLTVQCNAAGGGYENSIEASLQGAGLTLESTVRVSSLQAWVRVKVDPKADVGQRYVTIKNPTYNYEDSYPIDVQASPYTELALASASPQQLYQGDVSTVTITASSGWFQDGVKAAIGGTQVKIENITKINPTTVWLQVSVEPTAALGERQISIINEAYAKTVVTDINILRGPVPTGLKVQNPSTIEVGYKGLVEINGDSKSFETKAAPTVEFSGSGISVLNVNSADREVIAVYARDAMLPPGGGYTQGNFYSGTVSDSSITVSGNQISFYTTGSEKSGTTTYALTDDETDTIAELANKINTLTPNVTALILKGPAGLNPKITINKANPSQYVSVKDNSHSYTYFTSAQTFSNLSATLTGWGWTVTMNMPASTVLGALFDTDTNNDGTGDEINVTTSDPGMAFAASVDNYGNGWAADLLGYGSQASTDLEDRGYNHLTTADYSQNLRAETGGEQNSIQAYIEVDPQAVTGNRIVNVTNPTFQTSGACLVKITTSAYSTPEITSGNQIVYQNDKLNITITGVGFSPDCEFTVGSAGITVNSFVRVSNTEAIVSITVAADAEAGYYPITVKNIDYNTSYTKTDAFSVRERHQINSVSPNILAPGTTEYFYINGTSFSNTGQFKIFIDDKLATNTNYSSDNIVFISSHCVSRTQISCQVFIGSNVITGLHDVSVYFEKNGSTVTKEGVLTIPKQPSIIDVQGTVSRGDVNKEVTIRGSNFEPGAKVVISGSGIIVSTETVISNKILTFRCDVAKEAEKTNRIIKVINPTGQYAEGILKVIAPPKVVSCTPNIVLKGTTRYIEITGEDINEIHSIRFSGVTNTDPAVTFENAINLRDLGDGTTVGYAGSTQLFTYVYIGTAVVSGAHDINITNYTGTDSGIEPEAEGIGAGLLNVRTPLRIDNEIGEFRLPAGINEKLVRIKGDGFSPTCTVEVTGGEFEIARTDFIGSRELELLVNIPDDARLGPRTIIINEIDGSAVYKAIIEVIQAVKIYAVTPQMIGVGMTHATMSITGIGIDIDTSTFVTKTFHHPKGVSYNVYGIDPTGQIEISGGGISNIVIDSATVSSTGLKLFFTVLATAPVTSRDIRIINRDKENIADKAGAFVVEEMVKINMISPSYHQIGSSEPFSIRGSGFDTTNNYDTDGSAVIFSGTGLTTNYVNAPGSNYEQIVGSITSVGKEGTVVNKIADVSVRNKDGTIGMRKGAIILVDPLDINPALVYPTVIPIGALNVAVHIKGQGIMNGATAYFWRMKSGIPDYDEIRTVNIDYIDETEIKVFVRTNASGMTENELYNLTVENPNGAVKILNDIISVDFRPALNSVTPNFVRVGGEKEIVISGNNFNRYTISDVDFMSAGVNFVPNYSDYNHGEDNLITGKVKVYDFATPGIVTLFVNTLTEGKEGYGEDIIKVLPAPSVNTISPSVFNAEMTTSLYIKGSNFDEGVEVILSKTITDPLDESAEYSFKEENGLIRSSTLLQINGLAVSIEGLYKVIIKNADGSKVELADAITVLPPVAKAFVNSLVPNYANSGDINKHIEVQGSNFLPGMNIYAEGIGVTVSSSVVYTSSATLVISVDEAKAIPGFYNIIFHNPKADPTAAPFYITSIPEVTEIRPAAMQRGLEGKVEIIGKNFSEKAIEDSEYIEAEIGGNKIIVWKASTTFVSSTQLNAYIKIPANTPVGGYDVNVINPHQVVGKGPGLFKVVAPIDVESISPYKVARGDENRKLLVYGSGFENGLSARFSTTDLTVSNVEFISDSQFTMEISVDDTAAITSHDIVITNPTGTTATIGKVIQVGPAVIVSQANPSRIGVGAQGENSEGVPIEIIGSNFDVTGNSVTLKDSAGIIVSAVETNGANSLTAYLKIGDNVTPGPRDVTVITPLGAKGTGTGILEVINAVSVTGIDPDNSLVVYKDAFRLWHDGGVTSAKYKVVDGTLTVTVDGVPTNYGLYNASYDTLQELAAAIDGVSNWNAELTATSSVLQGMPSRYLSDVPLINVLVLAILQLYSLRITGVQ